MDKEWRPRARDLRRSSLRRTDPRGNRARHPPSPVRPRRVKRHPSTGANRRGSPTRSTAPPTTSMDTPCGHFPRIRRQRRGPGECRACSVSGGDVRRGPRRRRCPERATPGGAGDGAARRRPHFDRVPSRPCRHEEHPGATGLCHGCVIQACRDLRRLASPAIDICWVAAGRLDAAYETLRPWDVAAARLVAREMGVQRDHYSPARAALPPELRGDDVVFARAGLIEQLLAVLRLKA